MRRRPIGLAVVAALFVAGGVTGGLVATSSTPDRCAGAASATARMEQLAGDPAAAVAFFDPGAAGTNHRVDQLIGRQRPALSGLAGLPSCASLASALRAAGVGPGPLPGVANGRVADAVVRAFGVHTHAQVPDPMKPEITAMLIAYASTGGLQTPFASTDRYQSVLPAVTGPVLRSLAADRVSYARLLAATLAYGFPWISTVASHPTTTMDEDASAADLTADAVANLILGAVHPDGNSTRETKTIDVITVADVEQFLISQSALNAPAPLLQSGLPTPVAVGPLITAAVAHVTGAPTATPRDGSLLAVTQHDVDSFVRAAVNQNPEADAEHGTSLIGNARDEYLATTTAAN